MTDWTMDHFEQHGMQNLVAKDFNTFVGNFSNIFIDETATHFQLSTTFGLRAARMIKRNTTGTAAGST